MKLIFTKDENNEIKVQLQKGTVIEDFSYIDMVGQLLENHVFEDNQYNNLDDDEISKIKAMLNQILDVFKEEAENSILG